MRISIENLKKIIEKIPAVVECRILGNDCIVLQLQDMKLLTIRAFFCEECYPNRMKQFIDKYANEKNYCVMIASYISENTAKICKEAGWGYIDASGNAYISYESLYLEIRGNKNECAPKRALKSIYEKSSVVSSRILRTLLLDTNKVWKMKELAEAAGCSIGQVSKVKDFLLKQACIEHDRDGIHVIDARTIMENWAQVYGSIDDQISCYSLDQIKTIESKMAQMTDAIGAECLLTGFSGGVRYQPVVRYQKVHAFVKIEDVESIMEYLGLKRVETGGNVILIIKKNDCIDIGARNIKGNQIASPVQIYLDCMGLKGRGEEMAEAILEREICK